MAADSEGLLQKQMRSSFLSAQNMGYIDELYEDYLANQAVPDEWKTFFQSLSNGAAEVSHQAIRDHFRALAKTPLAQAVTTSGDLTAAVRAWVDAYRTYGHLAAKLDPLEVARPFLHETLDPAYYGLRDLQKSVAGYFGSSMTLASLADALKATYCGSIGVEFMHAQTEAETQWFAEQMESKRGRASFTESEKRTIFEDLVMADGLERYLGTRFVGQKRFSLEGGDALIPMLKMTLDAAAKTEIKEVVIGMAHRGRLNVLTNVLGKAPKSLFEEFEGKVHIENRTGDVKYHLGFSSNLKYAHDKILHVALAFNPSHLEIIGPVAQGSVLARLHRQHDIKERTKVLPIIIHGDAAFSGQGVNMEMLNFSQVPGFYIGGTLHLVINNQIGFTTSDPHDARSSRYCTDVAKMIDAPIIHVNGEDAEACVFAMQLAYAYKVRFKRDVVVDLICHRRHGHNEADEPAITQPMMYQKIKTLLPLQASYGQKLVHEGLISPETLDKAYDRYRDKLDEGNCLVPVVQGAYPGQVQNDWTPYVSTDWTAKAQTAVPIEVIEALSEKMYTLPKDFSLHPIVDRILSERRKMTTGDMLIDWGYAEVMAYATLLHEGTPIRLSGEDCRRGTFAHRHAVLHDKNTGQQYTPLDRVVKDPQNKFTVIDSPLSEEAVLAFEYGFASSSPKTLVLWEAQFGDFANGAQVVIDQFISSGEQKWGRLCGLVMLLPHGYEGLGPEHSSARLERYMQLCAEHNIQVCVPTTPAQMFHLLRRQMIRPYRKPLIVMTPKSLLRHKLAVSTLNDLSEGTFQNIIGEVDDIPASKVTKVVICSGKVYYDLLLKRRENGCKTIALIRVEQLYPFPEKELQAIMAQYPKATHIVWCQEEPENQGVWFASRHHIQHCMQKNQELSYAGRPFAAAPAVGSMYLHIKQQDALVAEALK